MILRITSILAAVIAFSTTAYAQGQGGYFGPQAQNLPSPQQPLASGEFADLIMSALSNEEGYSKSEVHGGLAQRLKADNKTKSPMFVEVRRLDRLADQDQRDCYNMRMRITMPELIGTGGKTVDFAYNMKMCSDGRPPQSVIEREKANFRQILQQQQEMQRQKNNSQN